MPYISIVMSVYNAEKYLSQAVESILSQSFSDFEFIIIEDCSTDNSLQILKEYEKKDSRIKLIQKPENKGMKGFIENLNIGLKEAKGRYIARMDADDISHLNRLEKQVSFLDKNPDIFMVGSSVNLIDEQSQLIKRFEARELDNDIKLQMMKKVSMYHPVIMFRNEKNIKYREKIYYCEDYDFYLRLIHQNKNFYNFPEPLLDYRILKSSISRKDGNFFRALFVEKVKQFYSERKKTGKDSYFNFSPESLLNILTPEIKSSQRDLILSLNTATKFEYRDIFKQILSIYSKYYDINKEVYILKKLNKLPLFITKIYFSLKMNKYFAFIEKSMWGGVKPKHTHAISYNSIYRYSL